MSSLKDVSFTQHQSTSGRNQALSGGNPQPSAGCGQNFLCTVEKGTMMRIIIIPIIAHNPIKLTKQSFSELET